jgi:hypothetical protein
MPRTAITQAASRASVLLLLLVLISCGGTDGGNGARPTISPTRTPTATLPSPDLPSPTRSPDQTESPDEPAEETSMPEEDTDPETVSPDTPESAPEAPAEDEGVSSWVWWLLAAVILGGVVAIPLVVRARRRNAWRQELVEAEGEVAWFARGLLPELRRAGSREQVAGGWAVGLPRVAAVEDRLTALESTAPDDAGRERARSLRDALRLARARMQQLIGPGPHDSWALDLDSMSADLEAALGDRPVRSAR